MYNMWVFREVQGYPTRFFLVLCSSSVYFHIVRLLFPYNKEQVFIYKIGILLLTHPLAHTHVILCCFIFFTTASAAAFQVCECIRFTLLLVIHANKGQAASNQ